jgi:UDP-N-acetylmuramoylalanine--D-glutamate ligase
MATRDLELDGTRVLVLGLGLSGRSAARFCAERGARVVAADERAEADATGLPASVTLRLGAGLPDPADFDLVVPSPGVARERYAARARRVLGDVELAARALAIPIVAVTGTNGKSTTVRLIEAMLRAAGLRAAAAGNVGEPALGLVGAPLDVAVLEVSSFQLEAVETLRPRVGVWLNATPDHLDRHHRFEDYVATKARLFARQEADDVAVLNADDPAVRACAGAMAAELRWFSQRGPAGPGGWLEADTVLLGPGPGTARIALGGLAPAVERENVLAALVAVAALGTDPEKAAAALLDFPPLPHRRELVAERAGVRFVDDSKATNPGAAAAALRAEHAPVIWIAGGRDKGLRFEALAAAARGRVRAALLIGEARDALAAALRDVAVERVGTLEAAVTRAAALAHPGDVVLLSPACASFDQFANAEARGRRFRELVAALGPAAAEAPR